MLAVSSVKSMFSLEGGDLQGGQVSFLSAAKVSCGKEVDQL